MANISKIKLPNGDEYNVKDTVSGYTTNTGTVTQVKVGTTGYDPVNGVVSLPAYPSGGAVNDVQVNSTSVVSSGVANIPLVSSASAGVAPKGTTVSTQSQSTKFLREDGTWASPSYTTNTTYTFAEGTTNGAFKVTPSGGTAQSVPVHGVLTSHQSVTDNNPTLSWGSKSKVATIGSTEINVTMPSNPASGKQDTITGAATTVVSDNLTASRVLISNTAGKISAASGVTTTEVGYLAGLDRSVSGFYSHKTYDTSISVDNMRGISGQFEYNGSYWMKRTDWADMPGSNSYGYLEIMGNFQRFTNYSSSGSGVAYLRMYANSEWSPWTQIKDTTYESKAASSGGTAVSLCTTGEKYTWNNKQDSITGGATTIVSSNLTASRALISNSSGKVAVSAVTSTELGYLDGVTSAIQTQIDSKVSASVSGTVLTLS